MTKHCSTIVPPSNFPSEFSENGKRHNIDFVIPFTSFITSEFPNGNSTKSLIKLNSVPNLLGGVQLNKMGEIEWKN